MEQNVTKKRSCDQINVETDVGGKKIKSNDAPSTPKLHVLYPPGEPCYVKVVETEETY